MPERQGDLILPGAFDATLTAWAARSFNLPLLAGHDQDHPIGAICSATATPDGLLASGRIVTTIAAGSDAYALAMAGALSM